MLRVSPNATAIYTTVDIVITYANEAMLRLWGKDQHIIGFPIAEAIPELVGQPFIGILRKVFITGEDYEARNSEAHLKVDGRLQSYYFDFIYKSVKDEFGKVKAILHTAVDVTERYLSSIRVNLLNKELTMAQEETSLERQRLHEFFIHAPAGICILGGKDLRFEMVNKNYQALLAKRRLKGRPIFDALPELVGQPVERVFREVYATGTPATMHEMLVPVAAQEGGPLVDRYFTFNFTARKNLENEVDGIFIFVYEVTEQVNNRKKLEESEVYFRHLADLLSAKIMNSLPEGEIIYCNKHWLDFTGLSFPELRALGYTSLMHPDEVDIFQSRLQEATETGTGLEMEMRFKNASGAYTWHLHNMSPVPGEKGKILTWVSSSVDIQKHKEDEERKANFISLLNHELKTPATTIKGYTQILLKRAEKEAGLPADVKTVLGKIDKVVNNLTEVLGEMLDVTRLEEDQLTLRRTSFSMNELVNEVADAFSIISPAQILKLNHQQQVYVDADREKISQVLYNIIENAIKFSDGAAPIEIDVFEAPPNEVGVTIKDVGIGIEKKQFSKIFTRFYTIEKTVGIGEISLGIGLYLAKMIIERHRGRILVESEPGSGSRFTILIPALIQRRP